MAVTFNVVKRISGGSARRVLVDITGPASYTTGGEALTTAQFAYLFPEVASNASSADWTKVQLFDSECAVATTPAFLQAALDKTNGKMAFTTAGAQVGAATNLSAQTVRAEFVYGVVSG